MYNKIRGEREMTEDKEICKKEMINNPNNLMYLGEINDEEGLINVITDVDSYDDKYIPFVWLNDVQEFMYYMDGKWQTSKEMNIVDVYSDEEIKVSVDIKNDKIMVNPVKTGSMIDIDKKIPLILSKLSNYDVESIKALIDCDNKGITDLDIIDKTLVSEYGVNEFEGNIDGIKRIVDEYDRWKKTLELYNQIQNDNVEMVKKLMSQSFVDDLNEKEELEILDMSKIYNEVVKERAERNEIESDIDDNYIDGDNLTEYWDDDDDLDIEEFEENDDELIEDTNESQLYSDDQMKSESITAQMIKNINNNEFINNFDIYDPESSYLTTDIDNNDTYLHVSKKYKSELPSLFIKVGDEVLDDFKMEKLSLFTIADNVAFIKMDDEHEIDPVASFTEADLISILKVRINSLLEIEDKDGNKVYEDNPALNQVLVKLMEAKMWLDVWYKTVDC